MIFTENAPRTALRPRIARSSKLPRADQFCASEFFKEGGLRLRDVNVFAKAASNPELQSKINEYMIENEVKGFDSSVSDDEVFNQIQSRYESRDTLLARIRNRISELRLTAPIEKEEASKE